MDENVKNQLEIINTFPEISFINIKIIIKIMKRNFTAVIEQDEDGIYIGKIPELKGCITQGKNIDELIINLKDAAKLCLEVEKDTDFQENKFIGTRQIEIIE